MLRDLLTTGTVIAIAIVLYRYHRAILDALKRFDAQNVQRIADQQRERQDPLAHYHATLKIAEEQVEAVDTVTVSDARLGVPVTRFTFEGEHFLSRDDAERARADKIRAIARGYYMDLPKALAERKQQSTVEGAAPSAPSAQDTRPQGSNVVPFRRNGETLH